MGGGEAGTEGGGQGPLGLVHIFILSKAFEHLLCVLFVLGAGCSRKERRSCGPARAEFCGLWGGPGGGGSVAAGCRAWQEQQVEMTVTQGWRACWKGLAHHSAHWAPARHHSVALHVADPRGELEGQKGTNRNSMGSSLGKVLARTGGHAWGTGIWGLLLVLERRHR